MTAPRSTKLSLEPLPARRQHRRTIVLALDDPSRELDFTAKALSIDEKNYHTWAYRQWVLCHFWADRSVAPGALAAQSDARRAEVERVWAGELEYVERLLDSDVRNNSAWNHRFFVAFESGNGGEDAAEREIRCILPPLRLSFSLVLTPRRADTSRRSSRCRPTTRRRGTTCEGELLYSLRPLVLLLLPQDAE